MLILGLGVATVLVALFVMSVVGPVTRFTTTAPLVRHLAAGTERTIYRDDEDPLGSRVSCQVVEVATGAPVPTRGGGNFTLTLDDEKWRSVASFQAERAGAFRVRCSSDSSVPVELALGPRIRIVRGAAHVLGAIASALVGLGAAAAIIAVTAVRRRDHRLRLEGMEGGAGPGTV